MMNEFGKQLGEFLEYKNISVKEFAERVNTGFLAIIFIKNV